MSMTVLVQSVVNGRSNCLVKTGFLTTGITMFVIFTLQQEMWRSDVLTFAGTLAVQSATSVNFWCFYGLVFMISKQNFNLFPEMKIFFREVLSDTHNLKMSSFLYLLFFIVLFLLLIDLKFLTVYKCTLTAWELAADGTGRRVLWPGGADWRPLSCPQVREANGGDGRHLISALSL